MSLLDWLQAARVKTLGACLGPAMVASGLAMAGGGETSWGPFLCCGPAALLIQVGTNLVNDALDFQRGADTKERVGPRRLTQSGVVSPTAVHAAGVACLLASLLFCLPAFIARGPRLVILVLSCCVMGYAYTGGPLPLAYLGLGDLAVFLFFGIVATCGAKQVHQEGNLWGPDAVTAGAQVGLMAVNMLAVNNLRDAKTDVLAGKMTVPVRFGVGVGKAQVVAETALAYGLGWRWAAVGATWAWAGPLATLPVALVLLWRVVSTTPSREWNGLLALAGLVHVLFCAALGIGLMTSSARLL
ncbi:unnamed protein product [Ostreobium quekettii]|uniref:1,4-dihydroxy-2-naphthoate octaprenyltransferase n=1 Tax=Ostreobium quekettii TaxID=121088 RepID=A0A8S1IZG2_9CHLO|nr:unnamed protein product [Ostreobium quekettii]|eukprot:evm.model.scf_1064EXC.2 EVM.evm.TU.scf_1064EXC.2   scf_1064EXC:13372-16678(-)